MPISQKQQTFSSILLPYQKKIEEEIRNNLLALTPKNMLLEACSYALLNGGKRFRPALVLMVANAIGLESDASLAALAIEYFHTASLIADDLPCMDDDDERRNTPSLHKVYGEAMALLATYCLIGEGYRCLAACGEKLRNSNRPHSIHSDRIIALALENTSFNTGFSGATGGQFLDIFPTDLSLETVKEIIQKKTSSLFEVSFALGWLYGGGDINKLCEVKTMASHFGMAFQIADDLGDMAQDAENGRKINLATLFGEREAHKMFHEEIAAFQSAAKNLSLYTDDIDGIVQNLISKTTKVTPEKVMAKDIR